eukprot:jgi/Tetstr1/448056/TSEL_035356.t1
MFIAPGQWKACNKSKKGKTTLSGQPEGSGGKEVTRDADYDIEEIEEIEGAGDLVIMAADGRTAPDGAEIEAQQRQGRIPHAEDQREADQLAISAADHDGPTSREALHLGQRAVARLERMEPRITNLHIELDPQLITVTQLKGRVANLTTQILDMAEGARDPTNGQRATQRTSLTADLVEMHDTKMIRPITTSHPLAEIHHIVTFLKFVLQVKDDQPGRR